VITPHLSFSIKYFEEYFKKFEFEKSGSVQQQLTVPQVSKIDVLYPPAEILKRFDEITSPVISQTESLKKESQTLTELRDWLLPMLMNGQVSAL
jgi:type I restriction enzyme S subunit